MLHQPQPLLSPFNGGGLSTAGFPPMRPLEATNMRLRGESQVFVRYVILKKNAKKFTYKFQSFFFSFSVAYDFEYLAEDGKRVFMKENEILLLINKTNHDWWQVCNYPNLLWLIS